jgi:hypothetical protein
MQTSIKNIGSYATTNEGMAPSLVRLTSVNNYPDFSIEWGKNATRSKERKKAYAMFFWWTKSTLRFVEERGK